MKTYRVKDMETHQIVAAYTNFIRANLHAECGNHRCGMIRYLVEEC